MPELPEVEVIRRQLNKEIGGYQINDAWYDVPKMLKPSAKEFVGGVKGKIIVDVGRRAKLLVFRLKGAKGIKGVKDEKESEGVFVVHLKLSGRLLLRKPDDAPDAFVHVILGLVKGESKLQLRFAEVRKFGYMQYVEAKEELEKILTKYGPEPLDGLTKEKFREILKRNKRKIKEVLMDQKTIAGVGNIYANEALWLAKIHPEVQANSLSVYKSDSLFEAIKQVLKEALKEGGASDQWYRQIHGEKGHYQENFKVFKQAGKKCPRCGSEIKRKEVSGRGTFFCPECQKK